MHDSEQPTLLGELRWSRLMPSKGMLGLGDFPKQYGYVWLGDGNMSRALCA